jgi:glutamate synthase (ferredoxin)
MASEIGVLDKTRRWYTCRLTRKMFLVDMNEGRIIEDDEIKDAIVTKRPYRKMEINLLH